MARGKRGAQTVKTAIASYIRAAQQATKDDNTVVADHLLGLIAKRRLADRGPILRRAGSVRERLDELFTIADRAA